MMNISGISNQSVLGKLLRWPLRLIPPQTHVPVLQGGLRGAKWIVGSSTHGCWLGSYEVAMQKLFTQEIQPGNVVYDIGANVGFYTLLSSRLVGKTGNVFSFEPMPDTISFLKKHIELNHLKNVQVVEVAVGSFTGTTRFEVGQTSSTSRMSQTGSQEVSVVRLDEWRETTKAPAPTFIKMDVEGAEAEALAGAKNTLQTARPILFLATHSRALHQQCSAMLREWNYELFPIGDRSLEDSDEILARPKLQTAFKG